MVLFSLDSRLSYFISTLVFDSFGNVLRKLLHFKNSSVAFKQIYTVEKKLSRNLFAEKYSILIGKFRDMDLSLANRGFKTVSITEGISKWNDQKLCWIATTTKSGKNHN